jgi:hypothetical protein
VSHGVRRHLVGVEPCPHYGPAEGPSHVGPVTLLRLTGNEGRDEQEQSNRYGN